VLDSRPANPHMIAALGGTLGIQLLAAFVPQLRTLLRCSPLALADVPLILAGASLPFLVNESAKRIKLLTPDDSLS
jgi:Ca2+-transporting ATPase